MNNQNIKDLSEIEECDKPWLNEKIVFESAPWEYIMVSLECFNTPKWFYRDPCVAGKKWAQEIVSYLN